ncbi:hypothetical protein B0H13DRAFT_1866846 [Mycena leptocephala]|nr:hypothetical protein B0H13DRAFT_1866846 [Mycena leptocephala]
MPLDASPFTQTGPMDRTPTSLSQFLAQERHMRLLRRLHESSQCLLASSNPNNDCIARVRRAPTGGEIADFLSISSERLFECIIVGSVLSSSGVRSLHLALGLPPLSSPEMDLFFRKQIAFLEAIFLSREQTADISIVLEDVIPWTMGLSSTLATASISINVPDDANVGHFAGPKTQIRLNTPTRAFLPCPSSGSSTSSALSSATLSSTDEPISAHQRLSPSDGDLLAALCTLHSRDFPRPSTCGRPTFVRVYTLTASCIEILV